MAMTGDPRLAGERSNAGAIEQSDRPVELLAPTLLEYLATRTHRRGFPVRHAGVKLVRWRERDDCRVVLVCGLAGALVPGLRPGDVFIPDAVSNGGGVPRACDPELVESLHAAARSLGHQPATGTLLTASEIVTGAERAQWAVQGFAAADMELGLLPPHLRIATVRVILDAPGRPISSGWASPGRAMLAPAAWSELIWLARTAPLYARQASRIAHTGLRYFRDSMQG